MPGYFFTQCKLLQYCYKYSFILFRDCNDYSKDFNTSLNKCKKLIQLPSFEDTTLTNFGLMFRRILFMKLVCCRSQLTANTFLQSLQRPKMDRTHLIASVDLTGNDNSNNIENKTHPPINAALQKIFTLEDCSDDKIPSVASSKARYQEDESDDEISRVKRKCNR